MPRLAASDAFQHWVYAEAPEDARSDDLDAMWLTFAQRFMPDEDWSGLQHERMTGWQREWSLFTNPLYAITYNLAQMGAVQVWRQAQADHAAAVQTFKNALALGNTWTLPRLYEAAGARLPVNRRVVSDVAQIIAPYLAGHTRSGSVTSRSWERRHDAGAPRRPRRCR